MPDSIESLLEQFPDSSLSIRKDGPPTFQGENPHRIIIDGNPNGFRMLSRLLNMMADAVETNPKMQDVGWYLVVGTEVIPQLRMDEGHMLSLTCEPD